MIEHALAIDGWMTRAELEWLARQASTHRCIVEIGSYLGRSTRVIADNTPGVVYTLDDWFGPRDVWLLPAERQGVYSQFVSNLSDRIQDGRCRPIRCDYRALPLYLQPDMVFIDGRHETPYVREDIRVWRELLQPQGLLCGHDGTQFSVANAVIAETGNLQLIDNTSIWYHYV